MLQEKTIGFLGAGSMSEALIRGLLAKGVVQPQQIIVTNRANRERLESLSRRFGVRIATSKAELVPQVDVMIVACKPKDVNDLLGEIGEFTRAGQILLSVAAGVSTESLAAGVARGVQVVRAMPNTSCQVGESATAICLGEGAQAEARAVAGSILGAVGRVVEVSEPLIDAVTGLSGSGPAYVYLMIEAMVEAGKGVGLPAEVSRELAVQTLLGAARMLVETGEDPALLRQRVTSPGGTTMAGLQELHDSGFQLALVRAVARATQRSRELGALAKVPRVAAN
ncbi:MAG TPA: pyrroline-5-carboxylate reductase [Symbiobacteriaceae bacterium]